MTACRVCFKHQQAKHYYVMNVLMSIYIFILKCKCYECKNVY